MTLLDISIIVVCVLLGFLFKNKFGAQISAYDSRILSLLWVYHILFAVIFYFYVNTFGGDARNYWLTVKQNLEMGFSDYLSLGVGTYFMYTLNYIPSKILELSFFTGSIIYSLIGYIGLTYYYLLFKERIEFNTRILKINLFPALFFLPNLHFWSSNVGKDTILFFCIGLFFYTILNPKKYIVSLIFSLGLTYLVRPHMAVFLLLSFGIGALTINKLRIYQKLIFIGVLVLFFLAFFDSITSYLRIENFNLDSISSYTEDKVSKLSKEGVGSSVDITSYPFFLKIFTFLFRPLFFDVNGPLAIISSVENLILLILSLRFVLLNPIRIFKAGSFFLRSVFVFLVIGVSTFSLILGNIGIMLRQKNMFLPALLFLCLWSFSHHYKMQNRDLIQSAVE